jgi:hypothetical protein
LWEYDVDSASIAWGTFGVKKTKSLAAAVEETEAFVRDHSGMHGRSVSIVRRVERNGSIPCDR